MFNKVLGFLVSSFAVSAMASQSITCVNGNISDVGDSFFQIEIHDSHLAIMFYESSFVITRNKYTEIKDRGVSAYFFTNYIATFSGEGETWIESFNGFISYNAKKSTAQVKLGSASRNTLKFVDNMTCTK